MRASLYLELINSTGRYFEKTAAKLTKWIDGKKEDPTYMHKQRLREEYSVTMTWESASSNTVPVQATYVEMDSPIPLYKRDTISYASGKIPKQAMKFALDESQIKNLDVLQAEKGSTEEQAAAELFKDSAKAVVGIEELKEATFLEGLSTGYCLMFDEKRKNIGVRVDYKYKPELKFRAEVPWGTTGFTPLSDIIKTMEAADITSAEILLSTKAYNQLRDSEEVRQRVALANGVQIVGLSNVPVVTKSQFNSFMNDEYNVTFTLVDRKVTYEIDGKRYSYKPFNVNNLVFLQNTVVGRLIHSKTAEEMHPVDGVAYQKIGSHILLSKYAVNEPSLREMTATQALVMPVIDDIENIVLLETQLPEDAASVDTETVEIGGVTYTRESLVNGLVAEGRKVSLADTNKVLLEYYSRLKAAPKARVKAVLEEPEDEG